MAADLADFKGLLRRKSSRWRRRAARTVSGTFSGSSESFPGADASATASPEPYEINGAAAPAKAKHHRLSLDSVAHALLPRISSLDRLHASSEHKPEVNANQSFASSLASLSPVESLHINLIKKQRVKVHPDQLRGSFSPLIMSKSSYDLLSKDAHDSGEIIYVPKLNGRSAGGSGSNPNRRSIDAAQLRKMSKRIHSAPSVQTASQSRMSHSFTMNDLNVNRLRDRSDTTLLNESANDPHSLVTMTNTKSAILTRSHSYGKIEDSRHIHKKRNPIINPLSNDHNPVTNQINEQNISTMHVIINTLFQCVNLVLTLFIYLPIWIGIQLSHYTSFFLAITFSGLFFYLTMYILNYALEFVKNSLSSVFNNVYV